jgi:putative nucleotidyltransferase with HDIG domain
MTAEPGSSREARTASGAALGLEAGLRARAPGVHASTPMVRELAVRMTAELGLDRGTTHLADASARIRDVGMLSLPDRVVLADGPLAPSDWEVLSRHPVIGAELIETIAPLLPAAPIVRSHHERWDGEGYPDGLRGDGIPLLSRVIATCDAFVSIASDRPYRQGIGAEAALEFVVHESGAQFDPETVESLVAVVTAGPAGRSAARAVSAAAATRAPLAAARGGDVRETVACLQALPAFGPAVTRLRNAMAGSSSGRGDVVSAVESDTGLTVAVLRRAQAGRCRRPIANVADAVTALAPEELEETIASLSQAAFPWTTTLEAVLHRTRVHSVAVARAAERIARETGADRPDDILAAALLHDVGRLVIAQVHPELERDDQSPSVTPEQRTRLEQRTVGTDHASLGGLLINTWGLPASLGATVAAHHGADPDNQAARLVRLADMVAHHALGDAVDRALMLSLARDCGLALEALRDVMFTLPHAGGSQRRRAEPSPLTDRETVVLRLLAAGKRYKEIAPEVGLGVSTVRTHLHNSYNKLGVTDRAQAVLRATEMGWI